VTDSTRHVLRRWAAALALSCGAALHAAETTSDAPGTPPGEALQSFYSANGLLNRGLHELAAAEYRSFLDAHANHEHSAAARYGLGVCLFRLGRYDEAVDALTPIARDDDNPYPAETLALLGQSRLMRREADAAAEHLTVLVRRHADHPLADEATAMLAEAHYLAGRHDQAIMACDRLCETWPDSPVRERAELFGAMADMAAGRFAPAAERFHSLLERHPDGAHHEQAGLMLAQCLHRARSLPAALKQYERIVGRIDQALTPRAMYGLAAVQYELDQHKAAAKTLDELMKSYPESEVTASALLLRGKTSFALKQFEPAFDLLSQVAEFDIPQRIEAGYWAAKCELRLDKPNAAAARLAMLVEIMKDDPLAPEIMFDLGVARLRSGEPELAVDDWRRMRERFPKHELAADALHHIASTLHQLDKHDEAAYACAEFFEKHPEHTSTAEMRFLAAESMYLAGAIEPAVEAFNALLDAHPESPSRMNAMFRIGMGLFRLDRFDAARPMLEAVADAGDVSDEHQPAVLALGEIHFAHNAWPEAAERFLVYLEGGLDQPAADDALLKLGLARQREGRLDEAIEAFDTLLERLETSEHRPHAMFERGQALLALDRLDEADTAFKRIIEAEDAGAFALHAWNHRGVIAFRQDRFGDAAAAFGFVADTSDDDASAIESRFQAGQALFAAGDEAGAELAFARVLESDVAENRKPESAARRAICLARLDRHEPALKAIDLVESEYEKNVDSTLFTTVLYEKAWTLRALNRTDEAVATYRHLLALAEETELHLSSRLELAELETDADRHADAIALLDVLLADDRLKEGHADLRASALYRLGACAYTLGDDARAAEMLNTFMEEYPEHEFGASAALLCGESLYRSGAHQKAIAHLRRVVDETTGPADCGAALLRLGEAHAALQQWAKSEQAFTEYLKRFAEAPTWFQAQFGVGWALENQGRPEEAMAKYRVVVERHQGETAARAQFQIGECLFALERHEEAARAFLKVDMLYAYDRWRAGALYEAGRCFEHLRDLDAATSHYQRVMDEFEKTDWARLAGDRLAALAPAALPGQARTGKDDTP
jgi:TolA-binding protein